MSHCVVLASQALIEIHLLLLPKERRVSPHQPLIGPDVAPWVCQPLICGEVMRFALLAYGM